MFVAVDENKNRIYASKDTDRNTTYFCPICNSAVRLRIGSQNAPHFAHINGNDCDDFSHDLSEWHRAWQELFPHGNREKIITNAETGETHRADVGVYGTVIEFQHSPISETEFWRRNDFYTSAGYKVVWIFDVIDVFTEERLYADNDWNTGWDNGAIFHWKHPWRFLNDFLPQEEKNIDIFFQITPLGKDPKDKYDVCYMEKVVWVNPQYKTAWGEFRTSNNKPANYAGLLEWLKQRWEKKDVNYTQLKTDSGKSEFSSTISIKRNTKYRKNDREDGTIINGTEFEAFLGANQPYRRLVSDDYAWKRTPPYSKEEQYCPLDKKVYRNFNSGICYGCVYCLAIEDAGGGKQYVYCKYPSKISVGSDFPDIYYRAYD